jgi:adenylate cyclase class IV
MERKSIEIKAICSDLNRIEKILVENEAEFLGIDHQIDTYFKVQNGRMKLREGNIENYLIHYLKPNQEGPKKSIITIYKNTPQSTLKKLLETSLGVLTVIDKERKIYFIDNVKFHLDKVENIGTFIEIEALDKMDLFSDLDLKSQCEKYMALFEINELDLVSHSYSDLALNSL